MDPLAARDAAADARLLWWAPEVAEPSLALRELLALARQEGEGARALAAADGERDPDRRRALFHRVESGLRDAGLVTALARAPLPYRARARRTRAARRRGGGAPARGRVAGTVIPLARTLRGRAAAGVRRGRGAAGAGPGARGQRPAGPQLRRDHARAARPVACARYAARSRPGGRGPQRRSRRWPRSTCPTEEARDAREPGSPRASPGPRPAGPGDRRQLRRAPLLAPLAGRLRAGRPRRHVRGRRAFRWETSRSATAAERLAAAAQARRAWHGRPWSCAAAVPGRGVLRALSRLAGGGRVRDARRTLGRRRRLAARAWDAPLRPSRLARRGDAATAGGGLALGGARAGRRAVAGGGDAAAALAGVEGGVRGLGVALAAACSSARCWRRSCSPAASRGRCARWPAARARGRGRDARLPSPRRARRGRRARARLHRHDRGAAQLARAPAAGRARGGLARDGAAPRPRAEEPDLPHPALDRDAAARAGPGRGRPRRASPRCSASRATPSSTSCARCGRSSTSSASSRACRARSRAPLDVNELVEQVARPLPRRARRAVDARDRARRRPARRSPATATCWRARSATWSATRSRPCPRAGTLRVRAAAQDGGVAIEVEDTGPGLTDEQRTRLFTPYYTTKRGGTGPRPRHRAGHRLRPRRPRRGARASPARAPPSRLLLPRIGD